MNTPTQNTSARPIVDSALPFGTADLAYLALDLHFPSIVPQIPKATTI